MTYQARLLHGKVLVGGLSDDLIPIQTNHFQGPFRNLHHLPGSNMFDPKSDSKAVECGRRDYRIKHGELPSADLDRNVTQFLGENLAHTGKYSD